MSPCPAGLLHLHVWCPGQAWNSQALPRDISFPAASPGGCVRKMPHSMADIRDGFHQSKSSKRRFQSSLRLSPEMTEYGFCPCYCQSSHGQPWFLGLGNYLQPQMGGWWRVQFNTGLSIPGLLCFSPSHWPTLDILFPIHFLYWLSSPKCKNYKVKSLFFVHFICPVLITVSDTW